MTLPAPNLDDRRFQDLVDDAKRMVQRKWPEWTGWTDHNVSDPGVTLIETFAYMVDHLLYRLNRVTDLTYIKLMDLIGVVLQPPTAAVAPITFWLTAPQPFDVGVPQATEVATERTEVTEAVVFRTMAALNIVSCHLAAVGSSASGKAFVDLSDPISAGQEISLFSSSPAPGDRFYLGLSVAVPSCVVALRFSGDVQGYGINPQRPPRVWQAWDGQDWVDCVIERDDTGGFNRPGDVVLHVPATHAVSTEGRRRGGWLRCLVVAPAAGEQPYRGSPRVSRCEAFTIGGTVEAVHGEEVRGEILGRAEGVAGQRLALEHHPVVLAPDPEILEVIVDEAGGEGALVTRVEEWCRVESFAERAAGERCFTMDPTSGTVQLPPAVRDADGSVHYYGAVPPLGAILRLRSYRVGGGRIGNVAPRALRNVRSSLPLIHSAENRDQASGGVDGESVEEAKMRGPLLLRTRDRAVTAADFEHLARQGAPDIARVRCADIDSEPGAVRVLVVPTVTDGRDGPGRVRLNELTPSDETLERIAEYLEERRVIGVRVVVERPPYQGVTVVARLRARRAAAISEVQRLATDALYRYYHPVVGGPDGTGWPFGRPLQSGEVHTVLQAVPGVDFVDEVLLFGYDVESGSRSNNPAQRIDLSPSALAFSFAHQVRVDHAP